MMHMDVLRHALTLVVCTALLISAMQTAHAVDMYARAIGEPYSLPSPAPAPNQTAPAAPSTSELPGLGTTAPDVPETPAPQKEGWSFKKILIGVAVVGAMAALAKGSSGGGSNDQAGGGSGPSPPPSGGGSGSGTPGTGGGTGGGGGTTPLPIPTVPIVGGGGGGGNGNGGGGRDRAVFFAF